MIETSKSIKNFYGRIGELIDHFDELETLKGENFNVFKLLNLQTKEDKFHTPFLANLLDPKGSHSQGSIFLESFVKMLNGQLGLKMNTNLTRAEVYPEKYIGRISEDKEEGGILDILITADNNKLVIENKIYAVDQEKQLVRYSNYLKKNGDGVLIYLNLFGAQPEKVSTDNRLEEGKDFYIITYKDHILEWLTHCKQLAVDLPIIRESINLYITTVKEICGISNNIKFETKMEKLIEEKFDLSIEIHSRFDSVKFKIIEEFRDELKAYMETKLGDLSYTYEIGKALEVKEKFSKIYIRESEDTKVLFVIESFGGKGNFNGVLTCGLLTLWGDLTTPQKEELEKDTRTEGWWPNSISLDEILTGYPTLRKLANKESRALLVKSIGDRSYQFISENEEFAQELRGKIKSVSQV